MSTRTGRFRRADRILSSRDFQRVGQAGKRVSSRYFVVLWAASRNGVPKLGRRLGVTVSRRVGNAVVRNRVKRGIREWFRQRRESLMAGIDLVVIARPPAASLTAPEIAASLDRLLAEGPGA